MLTTSVVNNNGSSAANSIMPTTTTAASSAADGLSPSKLSPSAAAGRAADGMTVGSNTESCSPTTAASSLTQVIDSDGNFVPTVSDWLKSHGFSGLGFKYSVTTVLGCQSSGKSTLLNALFGTCFPVMNAQLGRQQTTKGAWISMSKLTKVPMAVIDVEGTDSRERGEDRMTFEHRAALFSLALADVVVVNMWYHDLGRYTASNYGLLKTVLEVNLDLFQQQEQCPKTVLLFIIRDYSEAQTPLETLHRMIYADIGAIWKSIKKPDHLAGSTADDFFEFRLVGIPSVFVDPRGFALSVDKLRTRWECELCPDVYSRKIPADGFAYYSQNVWETILAQAELDIPTQKEMLATFRCEEIKNAVIASLAVEISEKLSEAQRGRLADFTSWAQGLVSRAIEEYNAPASRYQEQVYVFKRLQLVESICGELQKVVDAHLANVRRIIYRDAVADLETKFIKADEYDDSLGLSQMDSWLNFTTTCRAWRQRALAQFDREADSMNAPLERLGLATAVGDVAGSRGASLTRQMLPPPAQNVNSSGGDVDAGGGGESCAVGGASSAVGGVSLTLNKPEGRSVSWNSNSSFVKSNRFQTYQARQALSENLDAFILRERERQVTDFSKFLEATCAAQFTDLEQLLSDTTVEKERFWREVSEDIREASRQSNDRLLSCWSGLQLPEGFDSCDDGNGAAEPSDPEQVRAEFEVMCGKESLRQARTKLEMVVEWLNSYIVNRFQALFNSDQDGVPRQWHQVKAETIKSCFIDARQKALRIIEIFEVPDIDPSSILPGVQADKRWSTPLITEQKKIVIQQRAMKAMQRLCHEAQILQAAAGRDSQIPFWMYFLILALGWNEILAIVSSPLTLIFMLVVVAVGFLTYATGQTALPLQLGQQLLKIAVTALMPVLLMFSDSPTSGGGGAIYSTHPPSPSQGTATSSSPSAAAQAKLLKHRSTSSSSSDAAMIDQRGG